MSRVPRILAVLALLPLSGCFTGPYYMANEIYPRGLTPQIRLTRYTELNTFLTGPEDQTNYIAPIQLEQGASNQPGHVRIGKPCRFDNDAWEEASTFIPVVGTRLWLELIERHP